MKKRIVYITAAFMLCVCVFLLLGSTLAIILAYYRADFSVDEELFLQASGDSSPIYMANVNGELKEVFRDGGNKIKEWCSLAEAGEYLKNGFISMEDRNFYNHSGIDIKRTVLAFLNYIFHFSDKFGASTITQQVIKNISGDNEFSVKRKLLELFRAMHLEYGHTKDEILELYLNIVPMANRIYGVAAAAEFYFSKEPAELTVAESATLIGLTNSPERYNPLKHPSAAIEKRNRVLYAMLDNGAINSLEYERCIAEPLVLSINNSNSVGIRSWFIETAREDILNDLMNKYSISKSAAGILLSGCKIILTVNPEVQRVLDDFFENEENLSARFSDGLNYSMVVYDNSSGNIAGIIGRGGKKNGELLLNLATSPITPGSALKPISLYAPALDENMVNWSTIVDDSPLYYKDDNNGTAYPRNSPDIYDGAIPLSDGLKYSKNTVAMRLLNMLGKEKVFDILTRDYGFNLVRSERLDDGRYITDLSTAPLSLGQLSHGISLRQLTHSYTAFTTGGELSGGKTYLGVFDKNGRVLLESENTARRVMNSDTAKIMSQMLAGVVESGTASSITLKNSIDTAGKTGTSSGGKDKLFIGFTPYFTAGIWSGYPSGGQSVDGAYPTHIGIWDKVMTKIHEETVFQNKSEELRSFDTLGLLYLPYCKETGMQYSDNCLFSANVDTHGYGYFSPDNIPNLPCDGHIILDERE